MRNVGIRAPEGNAADFILNGLPRQKALLCRSVIDPDGNAAGVRAPRRRRFCLDIKLNKAGWRGQSRIPIAVGGRGNDQTEQRPRNVLPREHKQLHHLPPYQPGAGNYEQDDFQVRPTDIIGQHIHLVKFDVTSSDGSGNGPAMKTELLVPRR